MKEPELPTPLLDFCRHCGDQVPEGELKHLPGTKLLACEKCRARVEVTGHRHAPFDPRVHGPAFQQKVKKA